MEQLFLHATLRLKLFIFVKSIKDKRERVNIPRRTKNYFIIYLNFAKFHHNEICTSFIQTCRSRDQNSNFHLDLVGLAGGIWILGALLLVNSRVQCVCCVYALCMCMCARISFQLYFPQGRNAHVPHIPRTARKFLLSIRRFGTTDKTARRVANKFAFHRKYTLP